MRMDVSVTKNLLGDLGDLISEEALRTCVAGAEATVEAARREIAEQIGTGVQYPELPNRSSSPGEAPVNQLHDLLDSIEVGEDVADGIGADANVNSEIGAYLEFGTSRMEPRPFMLYAEEAGEEAVGVAVEETAEKLRKL